MLKSKQTDKQGEEMVGIFVSSTTHESHSTSMQHK